MKTTFKIKNLPIKRRFLALLLAAVFAFALPAHTSLLAAAPTASALFILNGIGTQDAPQSPATIGMNISGQIPLAQTGNSSLDAMLNERFETQNNAFVQAHMASALSINSTTASYVSGQFVSVTFTKEATSVSTTTAISTTVIDTATETIITLPDFNVNILQLINNHINGLVAARPHHFSNFSGVDANHPFFLDGDRLVIPFGSAELIPTERGIHEISLSISNIENIVVTSNYFRILPPNQYNTLMVRVGGVMRHFGYDVEWHSDLNAAIISLGSEPVSILTIGENAYHYGNQGTRELEVAPKLFNGRTYVPISFFSEVLGIPITVSSDRITLSRYRTTETSTPIVNLDFLRE